MTRSIRSRFALTQPVIVLVVLSILLGTLLIAFLLQSQAERGALTPIATGATGAREQREIDKLDAEIKQIRSDTGGSLFWLKMAGLFVTVGAAVGGYLVGQARTTRERVDARAADHAGPTRLRAPAERRRGVSDDGAGAVRGGTAPARCVGDEARQASPGTPVEWRVSAERRQELSQLTKQLLAASLAIEIEPKVLKALTIALALHTEDSAQADLRELDLSGAKANDAYWARIDFSYADFYRANLTDASLRKAQLEGAQFRETVLANAVLAEAQCERATFKFADLRGANLTGANLQGASFENVLVFGASLAGAVIGDNPDGLVDVSPLGDASKTMPVGEWLAEASKAA